MEDTTISLGEWLIYQFNKCNPIEVQQPIKPCDRFEEIINLSQFILSRGYPCKFTTTETGFHNGKEYSIKTRLIKHENGTDFEELEFYLNEHCRDGRSTLIIMNFEAFPIYDNVTPFKLQFDII